MSNTELIKKIESAKDGFGVITATALHDQLGKLTPADWREAAAIFSKTSTDPDGFYIADDASGKVTIHNDLRPAHELADHSVFRATLNDAKVVGGVALGLVGISAVASASTALAPAEGLAIEPATFGGAAAAGCSSAVAAAEVIGVISAAVLVGDLGRNYFRKSKAEQDIRNASQVAVDRG